MKDFEKRLERLEELAKDIKRSDIKIEEAIKDFEEGIKLSRGMTEEIDAIEGKIQILMNDPLKAKADNTDGGKESDTEDGDNGEESCNESGGEDRENRGEDKSIRDYDSNDKEGGGEEIANKGCNLPTNKRKHLKKSTAFNAELSLFTDADEVTGSSGMPIDGTRQ